MKIAIIPARGGSKRIKNKNIIDFCGKPMMAYALEAARESELFDIIHVSTDSERIADVAETLGFPVDFLRDPALCDDHTPLMPVLRWVLGEYKARGRDAEDVCLLMPCAPLIEAEDLRKAYAHYVEAGRKIITLAVVSYPHPVERALTMGSDRILRPKFPETWLKRSQDLAVSFHDAGLFSFSPAASILDPNLVAAQAMFPFILARYKAIDIDEPEDLEVVEILYRGRQTMRKNDGKA